jgi:hypothetical protein
MSACRQNWADFIREHSSAGRLLSARGDVLLDQSPILHSEDVRALIEKLTLGGRDRHLLFALRFIARPDLHQFCLSELKVLSKVLARTLVPKPNISKGTVRGRIAWTRTTQLRAGGRLSLSEYSVNIRTRSIDLPENRLLKLFICNISEVLNYVLENVRSGELNKSLKILKRFIDTLSRQTWLRQVETTHKSNVIMRHRARRAKDWRYSRLADFQAEYEAVFLQPKWISILNLLQKGWLEPIADDDLFELYTLFVIFDTLSVGLSFGAPYNLGLIRPGRREIATFMRDDGLCAKVFFDSAPSGIFKADSEYLSLKQKYPSLSVEARRPDLTISFTWATGRERRLLIECKDTIAQSYQRDSVYKCFGYLHDLRSMWPMHQRPKIILVFPETLPAESDDSVTDELVLASIEDRTRLRLAMEACLV